MKRIERVYQQLLDEWINKTSIEIEKIKGSSAQEIAEVLNLTRANTSSELNKLVKLKKIIKIKSYPVRYIPLEVVEEKFAVDLSKSPLEVNDFSAFRTDSISMNSTKKQQRNPFELIIGNKESLKKPISQAKAAVYYPPNGLHMLLLGPTGSGKTFFANKIYQYALYENLLKAEAPFKSFNCADYYHNPQLLISHLFGYAKGAFTGAEEAHAGLVEEADGGVLLLDEVHRLTPEGQEMLFYFIDHGEFNRMGETGIKRTAKVLIICATTENPTSALLATFLRRIPMTIQIPALCERSTKEKIELTKFLLANEAKRVQKIFKVDIDVINALIQHVDYGNVGQLKSQVQLVCAQAFLNSLDSSEIKIQINDLPEEIRNHWISSSKNIERSRELTDMLDVTTTIYPNEQEDLEEEHIGFNIYELITEKVKILEHEGLPAEQIHQYILTDLHLHVKNLVSNNPVNYQLLKFVNPEVSELTTELKEIAEKALNLKFDRRFLYYIGMHIDAYLKRGNHKADLSLVDIDEVKDNHVAEYQVAKSFKKAIKDKLAITLPEIEVVYLTMLLSSIETLSEKKTVSVLVAAHGNATATSMVAVATELLGAAPIYPLDMPLTVSPEEIFDRLVEQIRQIDTGKGVLMLVDMGSLAMMERRLIKTTNIEIKTIPNVTTSMVLDVVRKVNYMDLELTGIFESVKKDFKDSIKLFDTDHGKPKVIVSICMSGQGTAKKIEQILRTILYEVTDEPIEIISISALKIKKEIPKILAKYQVVLSVGTKNPKLDAPFISLEKLIDGEGEIAIRKLFGDKSKSKGNNEKNLVTKDLCYDTLKMYLVYLNPYHITDMLLDWIEDLQIKRGNVFSNASVIKLVVHTAFAFERVIKGNSLEYEDEVTTSLKEIEVLVNETLASIENKLDLPLSRGEKLYISEVVNDSLK